LRSGKTKLSALADAFRLVCEMAKVAEERLIYLVNTLADTDDFNEGLQRLLETEIRRRLNRYQLTDRQLQRKYGMTFEEFCERDVVKERGYSWEVESDYCDWEMAVGEIRHLEQRLKEVVGEPSYG